jgi:NAD(P)H-quinone oxidoreductase subunit M
MSSCNSVAARALNITPFWENHQIFQRSVQAVLGIVRGIAATALSFYPMLLKSTTRHIHLYAGYVLDGEVHPDTETLTLNVDPDNELEWNDAALAKVEAKFQELVANAAGEELTEYNLRRIGSDLEHFVRALLMQGEVAYNLNSRVRNYSLGIPRVAGSPAP